MILADIIRQLVGCVIIGAMAVTLTMSFAALIYTGILAPHLGEGIPFALIGAAAMAAVGAFSYSLRGSICNPQDVTAVLLGTTAVGIASTSAVVGDALFPTILALIIAASLVAGITALASGLLRIGALVNYAPYPVIAGFLAATGYLLVMGAIGIISRESVTLFTIGTVVLSLPVMHWLPWITAGLGLAILTRKLQSEFVIPIALCLAAIIFFCIIWVLGLSLDTALERGLLLGPFIDAKNNDVFSSSFVGRIEWTAVIAAAPTLVAVSGLTLLGSMLNSTGFAMSTGLTLDSERDMRATGISNIAAGAFGGMPGFLILGESILARQMGLTGVLPGLSAALACGVAALLGTQYLVYVPAGLMAMIVAYLGFDLLGSWLLSSSKRLPKYEYAVVVLIVLVAASFGFLEALALGTLATAAIFVISYAKADILRSRTTGRKRRSRVERSNEAMEYLSSAGDTCVILELTGFLFFGTSDRIARVTFSELENEGVKFLILDFERVSGLDASANLSLTDVVTRAQASGVEVIFCAMAPKLKRHFLQVGPIPRMVRFFASCDAALEHVEDQLLKDANHNSLGTVPHVISLVKDIEAEFADRQDIIRRIDLQAGEILLHIGSGSSELYILVQGQLRAEIETEKAARLRVAEFREGALIGELAYYANVPRTAWVVADQPSHVLRIDLSDVDGTFSPSLYAFHQAAARSLAMRVMRMNDYIRDLSP
ncbi:SulP family inorganic anion transporter [Marivita geojedonensis]|uniref:Sulfate permease n=1 Tax=Marivita geojedonensis TaxID=1123756 RepID=A0A1X4NHJ9_9RHOB|nr:SulP family inorganic anion transporter [Marivita geojedonensis]OSQ46980.1 hypothetical protein MGEO_16420 [Marivita geojedonensis]PRY74414.1 MFS superfamily sulfate permease-like transporter [Marivita geojedonensis]